jgi:Calcium-binding EGF domain
MKIVLERYLAFILAAAMVVPGEEILGAKIDEGSLPPQKLHNNSPLRSLGSQFGSCQYCRKMSAYTYKTVNVGFFGRLMGRSRLGTAGNCVDLCASLCRHQTCSQDFVVSRSSCECMSADAAVPKRYAAGAECRTSYEACVCQPGFTGNGNHQCIDIDECTAIPSACGGRDKCTNTVGSYKCDTLDPDPVSSGTTPIPVVSPNSAPSLLSVPSAN